jgi:hypothetical protein
MRTFFPTLVAGVVLITTRATLRARLTHPGEAVWPGMQLRRPLRVSLAICTLKKFHSEALEVDVWGF